MRIHCLLVAARNHTYSDELIAIGLADLVRELTHGADVMITRAREVYLIEPEDALDTESMPVDADPYLDIKFDNDDSGALAGAFDYPQERAREAVWRKWREKMESSRAAQGRKTAKRLASVARDDDTPPPPRPRADFGVFKALNSMRKGSNSYQNVGRTWLGLPSDRRRQILTQRLARFAALAGDEGEAGPDLVPELAAVVRAQQFFDPVVGKGPGRPKPDGASSASYRSDRLDWFAELLKYRAMHVGLVAYPMGTGGKDTRTLVLSPERLPISAVRSVRQRLLDAAVYGSVQADIRAVIATTHALIEQSEFMRIDEDSPFISFDGRPPVQVLAGLNTAFFLSLGSASAVMNVSFLGLPGWFPVRSRADADAWLQLMSEFRHVTDSLPEDRSEHVAILQSMLRCLSAGTLEAALDFFGMYATAQLHTDRRHPGFGVPELRRIFSPMTTPEGTLATIVGDDGFKAVASAIRQATVTEMFYKSKEQQEYEIRYGLAQEWRRAARVRDDFVNVLTRFLSDFEYESARKQEQSGRSQRRWWAPTTNDIVRVTDLIDTFGSELVCGLLLAFGFAFDPRDRAGAASVAGSAQPTDGTA